MPEVFIRPEAIQVRVGGRTFLVTVMQTEASNVTLAAEGRRKQRQLTYRVSLRIPTQHNTEERGKQTMGCDGLLHKKPIKKGRAVKMGCFLDKDAAVANTI